VLTDAVCLVQHVCVCLDQDAFWVLCYVCGCLVCKSMWQQTIMISLLLWYRRPYNLLWLCGKSQCATANVTQFGKSNLVMQNNACMYYVRSLFGGACQEIIDGVPLLHDETFEILAEIQRAWHMRIRAALLRRVPRFPPGITSWYLNSAMIQLRNKLQDNVVLNWDFQIIVQILFPGVRLVLGRAVFTVIQVDFY